jgi:curved DNA-binding protein CbpA
MEIGKRTQRKKPKKQKVENYYKILGIRVNASAEIIKQSYIQSVKQFTPEHHPEEFQQIRRAYETLRDPIKRREYDFTRKYGDSVDKIMDEALEYMEKENWTKAEALFRQMTDISPHIITAQIGLAQIMLIKGEMLKFEEQKQLLIELAATSEEEATAYVILAKLLLEADMPDQALELLEELRLASPEEADRFFNLFIMAYRELDRNDEVLQLIESKIPNLENQKADDSGLFILWLNAIIDMEKWQLMGKVQARVKQFLRSIQDEAEKLQILHELMEEHDEYNAVMRFREAEIFVEFAYGLDPKNKIIQLIRQDAQELSRIEKEIDRMDKDKELFPLVALQALEWFYEEFDRDEASHIRDGLPHDLLREMEVMDEEFAIAINRMKKKYSMIYRRYQEAWDALYAEKTNGLNREARRRLR